MPGTHVRDAGAPKIIDDDTITADVTNTATYLTEVAYPGLCTAVLEIGAVSGTNPTATVQLSTATAGIDTQGVGAFVLTAADANTTKYLDLIVEGKYLTATIDVGGTTPSFVITSLVLEDHNFKRRAGGPSPIAGVPGTKQSDYGRSST